MNAIATCVSAQYSAYTPMFEYCARKAYPDYDVYVFKLENYPQYVQKGLTAAALRFVEFEDILSKFDHVLITDADILIKREEPGIVEQHLQRMEEYGLQCYDNYVVIDLFLVYCPGVHFVTKYWWSRTAAERELMRIGLELPTKEKPAKFMIGPAFDEWMLYQIINRAGLPKTTVPNPGSTHGLHLGRYRKASLPMDAFEQAFVMELKEDAVFIDLAKEAAKEPQIAKIFEKIGLMGGAQ